MGSVDSGKRTDIDALRELLDMSPYRPQKVRDLDLYIQDMKGDTYSIIVLGNDLPLYASTTADIAMRRSPTVKEMINIRNAIKILNDGDVIVSKGPQTLKTIQSACIDLLDLRFDESDLAVIAKDGMASLENAYQAGVIECLSLFGELLGFKTLPKKLCIDHFHIIGLPSSESDHRNRFGPMVLYGQVHNELKLINTSIPLGDTEKVEWMHQVAAGKHPASVEGSNVFQHLIQSVLNRSDAAID